MAPHPANISGLKRKLQDSDKPSWQDRYRKYARLAAAEGYRFPGELLSAYGIRNLALKLKRLKAFEIPGILLEALHVDLSTADVQAYEEIRAIRNGIAHGGTMRLSMKQVVGFNKKLRDLAIKISDHLTENYFVIEKYAP